MYTQKDLQRIMHELNNALKEIDKRLTALESKSKTISRRNNSQKKELDKD